MSSPIYNAIVIIRERVNMYFSIFVRCCFLLLTCINSFNPNNNLIDSIVILILHMEKLEHIEVQKFAKFTQHTEKHRFKPDSLDPKLVSLTPV